MQKTRLAGCALAVVMMTAVATAAMAADSFTGINKEGKTVVNWDGSTESSSTPAKKTASPKASAAAPAAIPVAADAPKTPSQARELQALGRRLKKELPPKKFGARAPYTYAGSQGSAYVQAEGNAEKLVTTGELDNQGKPLSVTWPAGNGYVKFACPGEDFLEPRKDCTQELIGTWDSRPKRDSLLDGFTGIMVFDNGDVYAFKGWDWSTIRKHKRK